jgi:hypothetical protein
MDQSESSGQLHTNRHTCGHKNVDPSTFELRQSFDSIALLFLRQEGGEGPQGSAAADTQPDTVPRSVPLASART